MEIYVSNIHPVIYMDFLNTTKTFRLFPPDLVYKGNKSVQQFTASHYGLYLIRAEKSPVEEFTIKIGEEVISKTGTSISFKIDENKKLTLYDDAKFRSEFVTHRERLNRVNIKFWNEYWNSLHWFSCNYPDSPTPEQQKQVVEFTKLLKTEAGLPCPKCRYHLTNWLRTHKIEEYATSSEKLFKFFWELHNDVNSRNNKRIVSFDEAHRLYSSPGWKGHLSKYKNDIINMFEEGNLLGFPKHHLEIAKPIINDEVYPEHLRPLVYS